MKRTVAFCSAFVANLVAPGITSGQPVTVYSEFAVLDGQAHIVSPETPREILSPAVARNAFSTFQIAIDVPAETAFLLRVGLNPENSVKVTLYRGSGTKTKDGDEILEPIGDQWSGKGPQVVWMDLWVDKDAPVRRIKVEPQLLIENWAIYPMEVRVREPQIPEAVESGPLAGITAYEVIAGELCRVRANTPAHQRELTAAALHYRNVLQDLQLIRRLDEKGRAELRKRLGGCGAKPSDPEVYLRIRDYFFTPLWLQVQEGIR